MRYFWLLLFIAACALAQEPLVYTLAGPGPATPSVYDGAIGSKISLPAVIAPVFDSRGRVFFSTGDAILRLAKDGTLDFIGGAPKGLTAEGTASTATAIGRITALAFDRADNLYYLDSRNGQVRRIDASGIVTNFGPSIPLFVSRDMAFDPSGNLFVLAADQGLRVAPDGSAQPFVMPRETTAIAFDSAGTLYSVRFGRILRRDARGQDVAIPFTGTSGTIRVDGQGSVYYADSGSANKVDTNDVVTRLAGTGLTGYSGEFGYALNATFRSPNCAVRAPDGGVYVCDTGSGTLRYVDTDGIIRSVAGNGIPARPQRPRRPERATELSNPSYVLDSFGNLYFRADEGFYRYNGDGTVTYLFGDNTRNDPGESGFASGSPLNFGVVFDPNGSGISYVSDYFLRKIYRVRPDGTFDHIAGSGGFDSTGDGGPALRAGFIPQSTVALPNGDLLIIDRGEIRRISAASGLITRYLDSRGFTAEMFARDTIPAGSPIPSPWNIALGPDGALYLVASGPVQQVFRIYRQNTDGAWTAIAGKAGSGIAPDSGRSLELLLNAGAGGLGFDRDGNTLFSQFVIDSGPGYTFRFRRDGTYDRIGQSGLCYLPYCDAIDSDGFPLATTKIHSIGMTALANGDLLFTDTNAGFQDLSSVRVIPVKPVEAFINANSLRFNATDRHQVLSFKTNPPVPYTVQVNMQNGDLWLRADKTPGLTSEDMDISISPDGIPFGTYRGNLLVTIPALRPQPFVIPVEMTVP